MAGGFNRLAVLGATIFTAGAPAPSLAHPHVFVEANLEIIRNGSGAVTELRHVWRFDELFSSTVLLDFDGNGDGKLDVGELDEVSEIVTESIGENGFFTQIRLRGKSVPFREPERIMVDYIDGQVLMFFALPLNEPASAAEHDLRISVADPSYYVAMDIAGEASIQITGNGQQCQSSIQRPDFDRLYAENQDTLTEQFFADPANASLGDEWMTWVVLKCS